MSSSPDLQSPPGVVELREDVPLKPGGGGGGGGGGGWLCGGGGGGGGGGPRLILAAFAALSLAVTVALLTQIYAGDYEVVPHGSVSSSAARCSAAGAAAMRGGGGGGRAADAAVAAALCLAVLAPHRTSLDASGSLIYWEYRSSRSQLPTVVEWGGVAANETLERAPRLLVALAALHQRYGTKPWAELLQPAVDLARAGYAVPAALAAAAAARGVGGYAAPRRSDPALADRLAALQRNTSGELCLRWGCAAATRWAEGAAERAGAWRVWGAGAGGRHAAVALRHALAGSGTGAPAVLQSVISSLQQQAAESAEPWPGGVASGVAVVDPQDTYIALVTGLSTPFGSGAGAGADAGAEAGAGEGAGAGSAWVRDEPTAPLDLAPAIIVDQHVCGTRYILGAESSSALAQGAAAMLLAAGAGGADGADGAGGAEGAVEAVERARTLVLPEPPAPSTPSAPPAPQPPALNFVLQRGDALLSHADSRGGGVASRF